jgi:hypothetical protein
VRQPRLIADGHEAQANRRIRPGRQLRGAFASGRALSAAGWAPAGAAVVVTAA